MSKTAVRILALSLVILTGVACRENTSTSAEEVKTIDPFVGIDVSALPDARRRELSSARTEFDRAMRGLPPICKSEVEIGVSDGGTSIYECQGYKLTVRKSIASLHGQDGFLYGPIVEFPTGETVSDIRFYTNSAMADLLHKK